MNTFVVTGSNIPTAADATDVPVAVIGKSDIMATGLNANVFDILRKEMVAFNGRSNTGTNNGTNINQQTAGGSQIALRNLDTLVLVNGRRVVFKAFTAVNGKSFVDLNLIPTAEIDHMEVLTDGASAIYGSDAVGGVVNIITKSNYQGTEVGGRYAVSSNAGHYSERSAYVVAGGGKNGVNITVSGSWSQTDPIWQSQRPFISTNIKSGTAFPGFVAGNYLSPSLNSPSQTNPTGANATAANMAALIANGTYIASGSSSIPPFNAAPYQTIMLKQKQIGAMVNFSAELAGKKLVAFGDYLYMHTHSLAQTIAFIANAVATTVPAGAPYNPTQGAVAGVVAGSLNRPVQTLDETIGHRMTFGFRGEINADWNWEVGSVYSGETVDQKLTNLVFLPNLAPSIAGGYDASGNPVAGGTFSKVASGFNINGPVVVQPAFDPFARAGNNPASLANLYGTELIHTKSRLAGVDSKIVGTPFSLPAGKVGFAFGAAEREEVMYAQPDNNSYNLSTAPTMHNWGNGSIFFDPFSRNRTIDSLFGELRVPVAGPGWNLPGVHTLDVSLAGRAEKYSDSGKSSVPKIGLRWQPIDEQFTVRFTYSKSYSAPLMYQEYASPTVQFTAFSTLISNNVTRPDGTVDPKLATIPYFSGNGNDPTLQPAHAWSRSLGFVFSPKAVKGLTLTADYINVRQIGLAQGIGAVPILSSVNTLGATSPYFNLVALGGIPGTAAASNAALAAPYGLYNALASASYKGDLNFIDHFINAGGIHIEAIDFSPEYQYRTETMGKFTLGTSGSYLKNFQYSAFPGAPYYEFAGYATNGAPMTGTLSKWSFYTTLDWQMNNWELTIGNTYRSSVTDIQSGQIPAVYLQTHPATTVDYYTAWDLQVGYSFDKASAARLANWLTGTRIAVGVNNLFNRMPPYSPMAQAASVNNNNVDVATYNPVGRLFFVSAEIKF